MRLLEVGRAVAQYRGHRGRHEIGGVGVACRAMPVLITGAETTEGRATARRFLRSGGQIRAFVDVADAEAAEALRAAGCVVARGSLDDEGHLETAAEQVHTIVHLGRGPMTDPDAVLDDAATVLSAAIGAGCARMIFASHVGAGDPRGNAFLEACAEVESMLGEAPLETVIVRRSLTYGPGDPLTEALAAGSLPPEAAESTHQPLYVADLAMVLVEADRIRGGVDDLSIELTLTGPTEVVMAGFADLLTAPGRNRANAPVLPAAAADLLARDLVIDGAMVGPTDISEGLERMASE